MYTEAMSEMQKGSHLGRDRPKAILAYIYARTGRTPEARAVLSELLSREDAPAYYIALAYVGLGDSDGAFTWLEKAFQERTGPFNELRADPIFDGLRTDPRFNRLLRRMGLPTLETTPS
jgi:hypothetical protein